ncbi:MAG: hypothetical protein LBG15_16035 [Dysgonamonadaceae bacterium]|jgi:hypothetical protein|nr:hypothetical protein [Dysgonamonadaceae bacterium]
MIRYFNPGHETAVLNASKYYQPKANQLKMQKELAFLPAWYAFPSDFILIDKPLPNTFLSDLDLLNPIAQAITTSDLTNKKSDLADLAIDLWGISPQSIYFFEKLNLFHHLEWQIPLWKEELRLLGSRFTSHKILSFLIDTIPEIENEILPRFFSNLDELEKQVVHSSKEQIVKSPYSSSGRGLVWLPPKKLAQSERQILSGMLKRQSQVSLEKVLDKQLDFSMHFEIDKAGKTLFTGYSVFQTNSKGVYEKSFLANQEELEKKITFYIAPDLLLRVKIRLIQLIGKIFAPHYTGNIGVDMLVYSSENQYYLHPCVEINMRKSMGFLALRLFENYISHCSKGEFFVNYCSKRSEIYEKHKEWKKSDPVVTENGKIKSGYLSLCPVEEDSEYWTGIKVKMDVSR